MTNLAKRLVVWAADVKKALTGAASVLVFLQAYGGTPTDVKAVATDLLAVLATFGVVWKATNS